MGIEIVTDRFVLRELTGEDVTERYLGWLLDPETRKYITAAALTESLADVRRYVEARTGRDDVIFLGIFEKSTGLHIGNIKYEPVNSEQGYAVMGIMIGDPDYRSIGAGTEVLKASSDWLKLHRNIRQILLGVSDQNPAAIRSYEKVGFVIADTPYIKQSVPEQIIMVKEL